MSVVGTQLKININVEPIGETHLSDCDFNCTFFISKSKPVRQKKTDLIKVDNDNYIALVDSSLLGTGTIMLTMEINVPDTDFPNGYRKEVSTVCTGVTIQGRDVY